jgi:hypothetical protein
MDVAAFDSSGGYCAMQVPDWDFNWQQFYFFDQPLGLHYDELVRLSCAYDTREREGIVPFGEGTSDEMCVAGFYVTIGLTDDSVPASALGKPVADLDGPSSIASPLSVQYATSLGQRGYETMRDLSLAPDGTSWVLAYSESPFLEIGGERVSGAGGGDAVLLHYDEAGVPQQATFIGGSASDSMAGMDALPDGGFWLGGTFRSTDLQLAGSSFSSQGSSDLLFARVDAEGEVVAAYAFGGAGAESMRFIRALPDGGLIAATGFTGSLAVGDTTFTGLSADNQNGLLLLLNADGSLRLGEVCASESYCIVRNALVDHQGRLVVIGYFVDSATFAGATLEGHGSYDAFVASLSSSGELLWVDTFGDKATDLVRALQVDSQDNLYVGGYFSGTVFPGGEAVSFEGGTDGLLLSYTPDGTLRWSQIFTGIATDDIQRLILNGDDQLILAGNYEGNTHLAGQKLYNYGGVDILVAAYSTNGAFQWAERFGSRASEWSPALAGNGNGELVLGFGGYGGVTIDGQSLPVYGGGDIFLTRFDF